MGHMLATYLEAHSANNEEELLDNLAYILSHRRSRLSYIVTVSAAEKLHLQTRLRTIVPFASNGIASSRFGFLFTDQGAQWWRMSRELLHYPVCKDSIRLCNTIVKHPVSDWSVMTELLNEGSLSRVNEAVVSLPLSTALQVALVALLYSWNIHSQSVVGHSSGEIAAAYATGTSTLESATTVAYFRSWLSPKVKSVGYDGRMMVVGLAKD